MKWMAVVIAGSALLAQGGLATAKESALPPRECAAKAQAAAMKLRDMASAIEAEAAYAERHGGAQRYVGLAEGTTSETPTEAEVIAAPTVAPVVANSAPPTVAVNRPRRVERPEARRAVAVRKPPGRPEYVAPDILKILATGPATAREIASLLYPETNENIAVKRLQNALTKLVRSERVKVVEPSAAP